MKYNSLKKDLADRKVLLKKGLENHRVLDAGLRKVLVFTAAIEAFYNLGTPVDEICKDFKQSSLGKGFHTMSAYGRWYATEAALTQAFDGTLAKGQKNGCWEHVQPFSFTLSLIKNELIENGFDTLSIAEIIVDGTVKCFVSKEEDELLNEAGLNNKLPVGFTSIFDRYTRVGIEPIELKHHDFNNSQIKDFIKKKASKTKAKDKHEFIKEMSA